jgi:hypothetical protein
LRCIANPHILFITEEGDAAVFHNPSDIKQYALAGHATLTLSSQRTGNRYTYKINQAKDDNGQPKAFWFVGLLTGPDNVNSYTYMGVLNGEFKLTSKSRYSADSIPVRAFQFFWRHIDAGQLPPEMEIRHEGSCGRCGRKLTVPASVDSGIGPECARRMG